MDNSFRKPRRREYLSSDEIERLLAASKTFSRNPERDYCLLLLMFRHGLRISELTSLKLSDVKLELRELHVRRCKGSDGGPHPLFNGETGGHCRLASGTRETESAALKHKLPLAMSESLAGDAGARLQVDPDVHGCAARSATYSIMS